MTDAIDWTRAADPRRRIGHHVEHHSEIGSTNDRARQALDEPHGDGLAILAELQTAGRGRRGRTWQSPSGRNLMLSVATRPHLAASAAGLLGAGTALAVHAACTEAADAAIAVKWPNDVVDLEGRKVAGMLLETALAGERLAHVVIGLGINVNWRRDEMPADISSTATSLADLAAHDIDRVALLGRLLDALDAELAALERGESPLERYRALSWLNGRRVRVALGEREVEGVADGIGPTGELLLTTAEGRLAVTVGEVLRVRPPAAVPA